MTELSKCMYLAIMLKAPKAAPAKGPTMTIRLRNRKELDTIRRAAKDRGISLNTFVVESTFTTAQAILSQSSSGSHEEDLKASA